MTGPVQLTFPIDEELLDPDEIEQITGSPQKELQIAWLKENFWYHELSRRGNPIVGRLYARLKLAGVDLRTLAPAGVTVALPDFSKAR